ncbi:hypothetical protein H310_03086 [Aphanomyces invadans]|uniref:Uncharacterized protein n=1 Tax=Aphanomyces invadans TaxID=157072 RepID=A0A024UKM7_9STRA|nr:hypothetical protein H310_03086 [Aphanomyces invadans]ETW06986.1 hypothetical protein H310_03086 [Aphanomyces invadans]|eukprot:XP_008865061.1 hypothetical protein H310_03086 [Aphanomyces invadans]
MGCGADYDEGDVAAVIEAAADNSIRKVVVDGFELVDRQRHASPKKSGQPRVVSIQPRLEFLTQTDMNAQSGSLLQSSLHKIAQLGQVESLEVALDRHIDVNAVDANGWTALHYCAADMHHLDATAAIATTLLLCEGIEPDVRSMQGRTPLHVAASTGRDDVLQLLLLHGANSHSLDEHGMSPLHAAAQSGHVSVAERLLLHSAANDSPRSTRRSRHSTTKQNPLHLAASAGHNSMVQLLCAWDAEDRQWTDEKDCHGRLPVQLAKTKATRDAFVNVRQAAFEGNPDAFQACLRTCCRHDLAPTPRTHKSLLHLAVMGFTREVATQATIQRSTPDASLGKREARFGQTIRLAWRALADVQERPLAGDDVGMTPLMLVAATGNVFLAQELVRAARQDCLEATDQRGNTALHYAYAYCHSSMARWIEGQSVDLAAVENNDQRTPLDVSGFRRKIHPEPVRVGYHDKTKDDDAKDD